MRRQLFWERVEEHRQSIGRPPRSQFDLRYRHDLFELTGEDGSWLAKDARARSDVRERLLAFDALAFLPRYDEANESHLAMLREVARGDAALSKRLERLLARTTVQRPEKATWTRQRSARKLRVQRTRTEDRAALEGEAGVDPATGPTSNALCYLLRKAREKGLSNRYGGTSTDSLREHYGDDIADAARQGWRMFWRQGNPSLQHERERNTTSWNVIVGLVGLGLDFECGLDPSSLDESEAVKATRYAANELNGFPQWFREVRCNLARTGSRSTSASRPG